MGVSSKWGDPQVTIGFNSVTIVWSHDSDDLIIFDSPILGSFHVFSNRIQA